MPNITLNFKTCVIGRYPNRKKGKIPRHRRGRKTDDIGVIDNWPFPGITPRSTPRASLRPRGFAEQERFFFNSSW